MPDEMTVETERWVANVLEEGIRYHRQRRDEGPLYYHRLCIDEASARNQFDGGERTEFVAGTDFTRSFDLVVQNVMQTARWLELQRIERADGGLGVDVRRRPRTSPTVTTQPFTHS